MQEQDNLIVQSNDVIITASAELMDSFGESEFVWGYYFCIENNSDEKITLIGKDWNITDDKGNRFSDMSQGFKGEEPEIEPGEFFEFSSTAPLSTANAVFYGSCRIMKNSAESAQDVRLPILHFDAGAGEARVLN